MSVGPRIFPLWKQAQVQQTPKGPLKGSCYKVRDLYNMGYFHFLKKILFTRKANNFGETVLLIQRQKRFGCLGLTKVYYEVG